MDKTSAASHFRIVMIGKNPEEKAQLATFITAKSIVPYGKLCKQSSVFCGEWRKAEVKVYNTSDLFAADATDAGDEVQRLLSLCRPETPNAFLLLIDPSDFTKSDRERLGSLLTWFGDDAIKSSLMIVTKGEAGWGPVAHKLRQDCGRKCLTLNLADLSASVLKELMEAVENVIVDNQDLYRAGPGESEPIYQELSTEPPLNVVLLGRYRNWKASVMSVVLGQRTSAANMTKSKDHTGQVSGRRVSIVDLPALSCLKPDEARQESLHCLSQCEPEGVHAFVLVQPVGPLVPEDKQELDAIRREFTSKMYGFKMILFAVDSESGVLAVSNFIARSKQLRELCESCDRRYVILNINNKERVPDVVKMVANISRNGSKSFTREMTKKPVVKKRQTFLNKLPVESSTVKPNRHSIKKEVLRIVLIGKTGAGKSATANTILDRTEFESKISQTSVTKFCKKAEGKTEGRPVVIVDTPGLFDTSLSNAQVQQELVKCVSMLAPGPHVFLLILQIGRFTKEEQDTVKLIKEFFGNTAENHMIVVFTRGDDLENMSIEQYLEDAKSEARALVGECGNRYHVLNNKARHNRRQVQELLRKIDGMVQQNRGGFYSSDIFQEAEKAIEMEKGKILKEKETELKKQEQDIEEKHKEKVKVTKSKILEMKEQIEKEIMDREKQVQEKQVRLEKEQENRRKYEQRRREEEEIKNQEDEEQMEEMNSKYENLIKQINTKSDASASSRSSLMGLKEELKQEQEEWQRRRQEWWAKRMAEEKQQREEENRRLTQLEREYAEAKRLYERKKREDEQRRREEERQVRAMQEAHRLQLEAIRRQSEEEARRQAEALNDFQRRYAGVCERRQSTNDFMLKQITQNKAHRKDFGDMKLRHKREMEELEQLRAARDADFLCEEVAALRRRHEEEIHEWIQDKVSATADKSCAIL